MLGLSIVIPVKNEELNIEPLVERLITALSSKKIDYQIIFIDDQSTDSTQDVIKRMSSKYQVYGFHKQGKPGRAHSLVEGFTHCSHDLICTIDGDLQYPPEAIPLMIEKILSGADVVVTKRVKTHSGINRVAGDLNNFFLSKLLHKMDFDVYSSLKVFKKEIIERVNLHPYIQVFDLEFLIKAKDAGYKIESMVIDYTQRASGKSKHSPLSRSIQIFSSAIKLKLTRSEVIPFHPKDDVKKGKGFNYKGKEFISHSNLSNQNTAFHRLSGVQIVILFLTITLFTLSILLNWHTSLVILIALLTILYFSDLLFNLFLIYRSFSKTNEIRISKELIDQTPEQDWPSYSVFCPLYKEWQVLPQFVTAMSRLNYPKDKLQVMLILEDDDKETIEHVKQYNLPNYFEIFIVPNSLPKTKPKACNYALNLAKGEYSVIYDAEDIPDPDQLKKAVLAFKKASKKTICIQAKLNFYNPHQNILTRAFTAEYSLWFDLVLTGLQSINSPIPLGGTSNHFKTSDLKELSGWDSFNVTEDCDLGIRLVKRGFHTSMIDSITLEEANSDLRNWFWQRTRWIKGYMQTYLVHMRNPWSFTSDMKNPNLLTFQLIVGGKVLSMIINPLMWAITISYFAFRPTVGPFIESFFSTTILYMAFFSLIFGNFLYLYYYMIGCVKHGHYSLVKYIFLVPFYWLAMSMAAWMAFYKLLVSPHQWSKTKHGLHLGNKKSYKNAIDTLGQSLIDEKLTGTLPGSA